MTLQNDIMVAGASGGIMEIVTDGINIQRLCEMSESMMDNLVKAVVDVNREIMAVDAEMHSDQEQELLENGSAQEDLWGINIYPSESGYDIEFDSMINIRPRQQNRTRGVEDPAVRQKIETICKRLIKT